MAEFNVGDIVEVDGNTRTEGEVVEVDEGEDGYIGVRLPTNGTVFSFWPRELVATGRRIDPDKLATVNALTKAMEEAERSARSLRKIRELYVLESIVAVEEAQ